MLAFRWLWLKISWIRNWCVKHSILKWFLCLDQGWTIMKILVPFQFQYFLKNSTITVSISILKHLICNINFNFNITICYLKHQNQLRYYQWFSAISVWISIFLNEYCNTIMTSIIPNFSNNMGNDFNIAPWILQYQYKIQYFQMNIALQ